MALLPGCSALSGQPDSVELAATVPPGPTYAAPTFPPQYTLTPTVTLSPTPPPSATPFQVVTLETTEEPEAAITATAIPGLFSQAWKPYESKRLKAAILVPAQLQTRDAGQSILVGDADIHNSITPLFLEIRFDQAGSYRLPEGIDATNPRNVLEALVRELEQTYTEVQLVRTIQDVYFNATSACEVVARARLITDTSEINVNLYLAVAIQEDTVIRFYGSSPASAGVTYISAAERIADSFTLLQ
ncbi:MAG: hypothetical protein E4G99_03285 [Anaerolineales bacterium]|nr:MAG: hypothetical protein E4G99_03285 [Anaerolineales bacterium]